MTVYIVVAVLIMAASAALVARGFGAAWLDRLMNPVGLDPSLPAPKPADRRFHESLFVADLHADTLKWDRDLLRRAAWGHVDVPRLMEGNVGLQVFTIVTKSPVAPFARFRQRQCVSGDDFNLAALLAAMQGRPVFSTRARALVQIQRLHDAVERSRTDQGSPELRLITDAAGLRELIRDRRAGRAVIGAILGIEGGHWIGGASGSPQAVQRDMRELFDLGVRQFAPTHRFDNALAGASEGCRSYGLTARGVEALRAAERLGMAVDLAHISPAGLHEALELASRPPLISHTGIQEACEEPCVPTRNLSDRELSAVLRSGGLIGVGYWPAAVGANAWRIADVMGHVMALERRLGLQPGRHLALGSDYDGSVSPFFDVSRLEVLTTIMRRREQPFDDDTIRDISGLNVCRLFARLLPGGSPALTAELCRPSGDRG